MIEDKEGDAKTKGTMKDQSDPRLTLRKVRLKQKEKIRSWKWLTSSRCIGTKTLTTGGTSAGSYKRKGSTERFARSRQDSAPGLNSM